MAKYAVDVGVGVPFEHAAALAQPRSFGEAAYAVALLVDRHVAPVAVHNLVGVLADPVQADHTDVVAVINLHLTFLRLLVAVKFECHLL